MEENKKLEAIMNSFKELPYDEKKTKVISLVESLWESDTYSTTLSIIQYFEPTDEYLENLYHIIMETKLMIYEETQEKEKKSMQQKMQDYMKKLNEASLKQKEKDEKEADELLNLI